MGAWGTKTFENDDAMDWVYELEESKGVELLRQSLQPEEIDGGYLEAPDGALILCAAEIIAALKGRPSSSLPDDALAWVKKHRNLNVDSLIPLALQKIDRVHADRSELRELWEENEADYPTWLAGVKELRERLGAH